MKEEATDFEDYSRHIKAALDPFIADGAVAGAVVLVADKDEVRGQIEVGFADMNAQTPMRADTLFWIASQTKPITGAALMLLVDEGKVALDDPAAKHLPEFGDLWVIEEQTEERRTLTRPARAVTVRDLLCHTSGLPFRSLLEEPYLDGLPLDAATRSYALTPLGTQPGTNFEYSNAGINAAGRIIEMVSGQSYEEFLQTRLLGSLGMNDTTFFPTAAQVGRLAKAYRPNDEGSGYEEAQITQLRYPLDGPGRYPMPAGGLFSTAGDLARFLQMVLNGGRHDGARLLSEDAVAQMTRKQTPPEVANGYGLGWGIGDGSFGHDGAYASGMTVYPSAGLATVYLVQHAGFVKQGETCRRAFEAAATTYSPSDPIAPAAS